MHDARDLNAANYVDFFCRHLVGISWREGPPGNHQPQLASGFLLQVGEKFCLATAAHVLRGIDKNRKRYGYTTSTHRLIDAWSPRCVVKEHLIFDFTQEPRLEFYKPDDGVDIAVIVLPDLYADELLRTIEPFTPERWMHQSEVEFDPIYAILGTPVGDSDLTSYPPPQVVFVKREESGGDETMFPQFVGTILPNYPLKELKGASGGPILGFKKDSDGNLLYWPVAVQSRWDDRTRRVKGTSLPHFAKALYSFLSQQHEEQDESASVPISRSGSPAPGATGEMS